MDSNSPGSIVITPVANGWLVQMPVEEKNHMVDQFESMIDKVKNLNKDLQGDDILRGIEKKMQQEESELLKRDFFNYHKDHSQHVFDCIEDVLLFLNHNITGH